MPLQFSQNSTAGNLVQSFCGKNVLGYLELATEADSFPVPTYLFFKGNERLGRNDVKVAGQAEKGERFSPRFSCGLPLMQRVLVKTASGATGNESATEDKPTVLDLEN